MAFVCHSFELIFALSLSMIVVKVAMIDKTFWSQISTLAISLSMLKASDVEGPISLVHPAEPMWVLIMLNHQKVT